MSVERPVNEDTTRAAGSSRWPASDHCPFNKGFAEWIAKHNRYSTMEALLFEQRAAQPPSGSVFARDRCCAARRSRIGCTACRTPLLMFLALYLVRGGVLEGRAGSRFCLLRAWYEFMIHLKRCELRQRAAGLPF